MKVTEVFYVHTETKLLDEEICWKIAMLVMTKKGFLFFWNQTEVITQNLVIWSFFKKM